MRKNKRVDEYQRKAELRKKLIKDFNARVTKVEQALSQLEDDLLPEAPLGEVTDLRERKLISDARRSIRAVRNREYDLNHRRRSR